MDRENVIKGLKTCISPDKRCSDGCPYYFLHNNEREFCFERLIKDTFVLLKEQEAVEPYVDFDGHDVWRCGKCGTTIFHVYHNASDEDAKNYAKFCRHCGQAVKWDA